MTAAMILDRLQAAGLTIRPDPTRPNGVKVRPPDRLTAELEAIIVANKAALLEELRSRTAEPTYTRCLDCSRYSAPPPDSAFWCPTVRAHPEAALWAICIGYEARPGTLPEPTTPQDSGGDHR